MLAWAILMVDGTGVAACGPRRVRRLSFIAVCMPYTFKLDFTNMLRDDLEMSILALYYI
jgi:hypothetical protein